MGLIARALTARRFQHPRRRFAVVFVAAGLMVTGLAACGGEDLSASSDTGPSAAIEPSESTEPAAAPSPDRATTDYTFTWTDAGDVTVQGAMTLMEPMAANDPAISDAWSQIYPETPPALECVENPDRDAVVLGTVAFTNPTPEFTPADVRVRLWSYSSSADGPDLEIHYDDDVRCGAVGGSTFAPSMSDGSWGPVPIAFVVPFVYGPSGFDEQAYAAAQENLGFREVGAGLNVDEGGIGALVKSFALPAPTAQSGSDADPTSCDAVWVSGQVLPSDYSGCTLPDGSASQDTITDCADGSTLVQLEGYGYAVVGERIADPATQDPALEVATVMDCES